MYTLKVKSHFDAAHYIRDYEGKCSRTHGHRWEVEVAYRGKELDRRNILVDFKVIKDLLGGLLDKYLDHYFLNETFSESNVTAEYLVSWIYKKLMEVELLDSGVVLAQVTIWESPECSVTYTKEEK